MRNSRFRDLKKCVKDTHYTSDNRGWEMRP